jgi:hypothetical protein
MEGPDHGGSLLAGAAGLFPPSYHVAYTNEYSVTQLSRGETDSPYALLPQHSTSTLMKHSLGTKRRSTSL